jgi:hypothetical protein
MLLIPLSGHAEWVYVNEDSDGKKMYIDFASIKNNKKIISAWLYQDWPKPDSLGDSSAKTYIEYVCTYKVSRINHFITYSKRGLKGKETSNTIKNGEWEPVPSDSILEAAFEPICEAKGLNKASPSKLPKIAYKTIIPKNKDADWFLLTVDQVDHVEFYIDRKTIEKSGNLVKFWLRTEFPKKQFNAISTKLLHEADCNKRKIRTIYVEGYELHNLGGKKIAGGFLEGDDPTVDFEKVEKGSNEDKELNFVCK